MASCQLHDLDKAIIFPVDVFGARSSRMSDREVQIFLSSKPVTTFESSRNIHPLSVHYLLLTSSVG